MPLPPAGADPRGLGVGPGLQDEALGAVDHSRSALSRRPGALCTQRHTLNKTSSRQKVGEAPGPAPSTCNFMDGETEARKAEGGGKWRELGVMIPQGS